MQTRLVRELEKKFSGRDVVIIGHRRIMAPPNTGYALARPRSRSLTAVHSAILEDVVYPTEIVGKRIRYKLEGGKVMKVRHAACCARLDRMHDRSCCVAHAEQGSTARDSGPHECAGRAAEACCGLSASACAWLCGAHCDADFLADASSAPA